jgi:hypothetical protein
MSSTPFRTLDTAVEELEYYIDSLNTTQLISNSLTPISEGIKTESWGQTSRL